MHYERRIILSRANSHKAPWTVEYISNEVGRILLNTPYDYYRALTFARDEAVALQCPVMELDAFGKEYVVFSPTEFD